MSRWISADDCEKFCYLTEGLANVEVFIFEICKYVKMKCVIILLFTVLVLDDSAMLIFDIGLSETFRLHFCGGNQ